MSYYKLVGKGTIVSDTINSLPNGTKIFIFKPKPGTRVYDNEGKLYKPHYMVCAEDSPYTYYGVQVWELQFTEVHTDKAFITKKEFNECVSYHQYGNHRDCIRAAFFGWIMTHGYKFLTYERGTDKKTLLTNLYDGVKDYVLYDRVNFWMDIAPDGGKVPLSSSGLRKWGKEKLIKY